MHGAAPRREAKDLKPRGTTVAPRHARRGWFLVRTQTPDGEPAAQFWVAYLAAG